MLVIGDWLAKIYTTLDPDWRFFLELVNHKQESRQFFATKSLSYHNCRTGETCSTFSARIVHHDEGEMHVRLLHLICQRPRANSLHYLLLPPCSTQSPQEDGTSQSRRVIEIIREMCICASGVVSVNEELECRKNEATAEQDQE